MESKETMMSTEKQRLKLLILLKRLLIQTMKKIPMENVFIRDSHLSQMGICILDMQNLFVLTLVLANRIMA